MGNPKSGFAFPKNDLPSRTGVIEKRVGIFHSPTVEAAIKGCFFVPKGDV